jgi:predicted transcriptional regulator
MDLKEWAKFQESLLRSQLRIIREFLKDDAEPEPPPRRTQRSQIGTVYDVLTEAKEPLHLTEIIRRAKSDFNVVMEPGSIVSALTKKVNSGRMFRRVAPSTFEILDASKKIP